MRTRNTRPSKIERFLTYVQDPCTLPGAMSVGTLPDLANPFVATRPDPTNLVRLRQVESIPCSRFGWMFEKPTNPPHSFESESKTPLIVSWAVMLSTVALVIQSCEIDP